MTTNFCDCWNSGSVSTGPAFELWKGPNGPSYVRDHRSVRWPQLDSDLLGFDDIAGTGHEAESRIKVADRYDKTIIRCYELRADLRNNGLIRPISDFGVHPYTIRPKQDAAWMIDDARRNGVDIIQCMNEVWSWPYNPKLSDYEALVSELFEQAGGEFRIIADFHEAMSADIALACWRLDKHFFWRTQETAGQMHARIEGTADAIRARGGTPTCLEYSAGRGALGSSWEPEGRKRHLFAQERLAAAGYDLIGVFYGYAGLGHTWTAEGWGNWYGLYVTDGTELSPVAVEMFGAVEPPKPKPEIDVDAAVRKIKRKVLKPSLGWTRGQTGEWRVPHGPTKTVANILDDLGQPWEAE